MIRIQCRRNSLGCQTGGNCSIQRTADKIRCKQPVNGRVHRKKKKKKKKKKRKKINKNKMALEKLASSIITPGNPVQTPVA